MGGQGGMGSYADDGVGSVLFGSVMRVGAMFLNAVKSAMEEFSMKVNGKGGVELLAWEGAWGTLLMLVVACPLLWFLPGNDHGHVEDFINTFTALKTNWSFVWRIPTLTVTVAA